MRILCAIFLMGFQFPEARSQPYMVWGVMKRATNIIAMLFNLREDPADGGSPSNQQQNRLRPGAGLR